jgi:hypothetical protein
MRRNEIARIGAISALALVLLSGCSVWRGVSSYMSSDNANVCPDAAILANTASLPAFDPAKGDDPSGVIYTIAMDNVKTQCDYSKRGNTIDGDVHIFFVAKRPSGGEEAHYRVPYFVAVTTGGQIVDKQMHWLEFDFPKSNSQVAMDEWVNGIHIDMAKQKRSFEYHYLVGFQLTQAQLDYNAKMGPYTP